MAAVTAAAMITARIGTPAGVSGTRASATRPSPSTAQRDRRRAHRSSYSGSGHPVATWRTGYRWSIVRRPRADVAVRVASRRSRSVRLGQPRPREADRAPRDKLIHAPAGEQPPSAAGHGLVVRPPLGGQLHLIGEPALQDLFEGAEPERHALVLGVSGLEEPTESDHRPVHDGLFAPFRFAAFYSIRHVTVPSRMPLSILPRNIGGKTGPPL